MNNTKSPKSKIMLVDDEENILVSLTFLLEKEGYSVASASNGEDSLKLFQSFKPDLVLMDVMMPEMDGFTAVSNIRSQESQPQPNVIFLTAKGTIEDRRIGYQSGADNYIVKPFDNQYILDKISEILE